MKPLRVDPGARVQRGYVMVLSMLILLLITIMSISMAKSFFLEEGMAGNVREKNRSLMLAQAALVYGETFAKHTASFAGTACTLGTATASVQLAAVQVCSNTSAPLVNATFNSKPAGGSMPLTTYYPIPLTALNNVATSSTGGADTYYTLPGVYIQFLGTVLGGAHVYLITAFGYGGSQNSASVVQSTFKVVPLSSSGNMSSGS